METYKGIQIGVSHIRRPVSTEIQNWLEETFGPQSENTWEVINHTKELEYSSFYLHFYQPKYAVIFKLRWAEVLVR